MAIPTRNLLSTAAGEMLHVACSLLSLCRKPFVKSRGGEALIELGAAVTQGTGDRGGRGPTGNIGVILVTIVSLRAAVVLWSVSLPHGVRGNNGHHLRGKRHRPRNEYI